MKCMSKKIKSQTGASILMAMVLFLICGFVAAVTLGAAATNAQKYTNQRQQQQQYLAVSSCARLLEESLEGKEFVGTEEKWIYFCGDEFSDVVLDEGEKFESDRFEVCTSLKVEEKLDAIQELIAEGLYEVYLSKERYVESKPFSGWTREMKIRFGSIPELTKYPVDAIVTVDRDYKITITLKTASVDFDNEEYAMVLTFEAEVTEPAEKIETFPCENEHHGTIEVTADNGTKEEKSVEVRYEKNEHYSKVTTIQLINGDIRKGV